MDRRTFIWRAGAAASAAALAGCLSDDEEPTREPEGGPPRYDLPPYSELLPAEAHTGGGVVVAHLRLSTLRAVEAARDSQRLPDEPVVTLPLSTVDPIVAAVETLSTYPFAAGLRHAVNDIARGSVAGSDPTSNRTLVEPGNGTLGGTRSTNRTAAANVTAQNATIGNTIIENSTAQNTTVGNTTIENSTAKNTTIGNTTIENSTAKNATVENRTAENTTIGTSTSIELGAGIEVDGITLADEVLLFDGRYDRSVFENSYTAGFQQVDELRGLAVYENGSGLGFAVGDGLLVVPTETDRAATADTVLAHTLSGYVTTLDRIVDDDDGQWLFETTGPAAFSVGVWGADDPIERADTALGAAPEATGPVFGATDAFIAALEPTVDEQGGLEGVETRFAGRFPTDVPTTEELRASLAGGVDGETYREAPRARLMASFGDS